MKTHEEKVENLQQNIKNFKRSNEPFAFSFGNKPSNTTRTKNYKQNCPLLDIQQLNEVIQIDPTKKTVYVEPRVTMESLLRASLPLQLAPPVLPEFRGITVGGAIMGGAGESGSHEWGCFNDTCLSYDILTGTGEKRHLSPKENADLYYGIAGSYGSLGPLVSTEIQLISVPKYISLTYHISSPSEAIERLRQFCRESHPNIFVDGLIFSKELAVIIEADTSKEAKDLDLPLFSFHSLFSPWYFQHVKELSESHTCFYREKMAIEDYFFRYDLGAFWMGSFLFQLPFLKDFILSGIFDLKKEKSTHFSHIDIQKIHRIKGPPLFGRALLRPLLNATKLWRLLHQSEPWIQNRLFIQDFCIPEKNALSFCADVLDDPAIFPIWLCPIKATRTPQPFSPHLLNPERSDTHVINFGLYGIPSSPSSVKEITKCLEVKVKELEGRKVLYSHSYYSSEEFWQVYSYNEYKKLRNIAKAEGIWHEITDKVLEKDNDKDI